MGMKAALIRLAKAKLAQVNATIEKQIQRLQNEIIQDLIQSIAQPLSKNWEAEEADEFKQLLDGLKQDLETAKDAVQKTSDGLTEAADILTKTDQRARGIVSNLRTVFSRVYK